MMNWWQYASTSVVWLGCAIYLAANGKPYGAVMTAFGAGAIAIMGVVSFMNSREPKRRRDQLAEILLREK